MSRLSGVDVQLSSDEKKLLGLFRQMTARDQSETLAMAQGDVEAEAARKNPPTFRMRLVASFGTAVTA